MADYMDPGYAASQSIEAMLHQRAQEKRQALLDSITQQRENRLSRSEDLELQMKREELQARREDRAAGRAEKAAELEQKKHEKLVADHLKKRDQMAPGDFASPELIKESQDLGIPLALSPAGQKEQDTPGFVGPVDPQAVVMGQKYLGNPVQRQAEDDKTRIQSIIQDPATPEPLKHFLGMRIALPKGENIPYQLLMDPDQEKVNQQIHTVLLDGKPVDALLHPRTGRLMYQGQDITDRAKHYEKPAAPDRVLIQTGNGFMPRAEAARTLAGGGNVPLPTTSSTRTMEEGAKMIEPHIRSVGQQAETLDKDGLFGPAMSRVRHAAETVGTIDEFVSSIASDPELSKDRRVGKFATSLALLASGAARVHYGGRAGSSPGAMANFKAMISDAGTLNMFLGRLDGMNEYMSGYAAGPEGIAPANTTPAGGAPARTRRYNAATGKLE